MALTAPQRSAIAAAHGHEPERLVELDHGYDFVVAIVEDAWVYRFPRRPIVEEALERELALLPVLAAELPVEVPRFELVVREPLFFVRYPLVRGTPLRDEDPDGVAAFLAALHGCGRARPLLEAPPWREEYVERCERFARSVVPLLDADERPRARAFLDEAETLTGFEPVPIHGDLLAEHMLCRDGRLTGVIDWGDARVGDPALDYAWLLNEPFPHWEVEDELRRRAGFYHRLEPWIWAHYGLLTGSPGHVRAGLAELVSRL
jgi:aminoglycoside phosphotransferase (APT) family kinase protein